MHFLNMDVSHVLIHILCHVLFPGLSLFSFCSHFPAMHQYFQTLSHTATHLLCLPGKWTSVPTPTIASFSTSVTSPTITFHRAIPLPAVNPRHHQRSTKNTTMSRYLPFCTTAQQPDSRPSYFHSGCIIFHQATHDLPSSAPPFFFALQSLVVEIAIRWPLQYNPQRLDCD